LPIITSVAPFATQTIQQAIEREVKRGGQVYFVHNRVQTIDTVQHKFERLMPEVKFIHAHGQMSERLLAKIMEEFNQNKYDVLIASTIIENGLDNPNVNTLIVDDAGRFGLSQLHQLRGRIGRGKVQAYAYFLYNKGKLSLKALERLKTIQENAELGSGYNIAMRDMQIRGAGGVLSRQQHGHITAIGLSLYTKLLNKAIEEMRAGKKIEVSDVTIDLPISAYLPVKYVEAEAQRLKIYQTLGVTENSAALDEEFQQIEENFGKLPPEVVSLKKLLLLKLAALSTQLVTSVIAKNLDPANLPPRYLITINLAAPPQPKVLEPILSVIPSIQIGEKSISFIHTDLKKDWLDDLITLVGKIKKV
jgi:transcription-repair coupling factor (superfamily II helicase)